jgi:hypothetical protein
LGTFAISFSVEVQADDHDEAYEIQKKLRKAIGRLPSVSDVIDLDVEQLEE